MISLLALHMKASNLKTVTLMSEVYLQGNLKYLKPFTLLIGARGYRRCTIKEYYHLAGSLNHLKKLYIIIIKSSSLVDMGSLLINVLVTSLWWGFWNASTSIETHLTEREYKSKINLNCMQIFFAREVPWLHPSWLLTFVTFIPLETIFFYTPWFFFFPKWTIQMSIFQ